MLCIIMKSKKEIIELAQIYHDLVEQSEKEIYDYSSGKKNDEEAFLFLLNKIQHFRMSYIIVCTILEEEFNHKFKPKKSK